MTRYLWTIALAGSFLSCGQLAIAQDEAEHPSLKVEVVEDDYVYRQPKSYEPDAGDIVRQRAMMRADQRNLRLTNLSSWGIQSGRPMTGPTPFTSSYGPTWQSNPYPFVWLEARRNRFILIR